MPLVMREAGSQPPARMKDNTMASKKSEIVQWDIDEASYLGDEDNGCYWQTGQGKDGKWYVTVVVDAAHFVDTIYSDNGPFETEADADQAGKNAASDWCMDNEISMEEL